MERPRVDNLQLKFAKQTNTGLGHKWGIDTQWHFLSKQQFNLHISFTFNTSVEFVWNQLNIRIYLGQWDLLSTVLSEGFTEVYKLFKVIDFIDTIQ